MSDKFFGNNTEMVKMINEIAKKCLLCQDNIADKTGSHIIPNFLIQSAFGLDDQKSRNREFMVSLNLVPELHLGRELIPGKIEPIIGRELTDDDVEKNFNNPFVQDHIFCSECEEKFSQIESAYARERIKTELDYGVFTSKLEPHLSHLFWLSVVWRISATSFAHILNASIKERIRRILNNCLKTKLSEIPSIGYNNTLLINFGYYLIHFKEDGVTKGGYYPPNLEISTSSNIFFINNYVLFFYSNANNFRDIPDFFGLEGDIHTNNFNKSTQQERCVVFNSEAYGFVIAKYNDLKIKEFTNNIKDFVTKEYRIECSDSLAKQIMFEYVNETNSIVEFLNALNIEKLHNSIEKIMCDNLRNI